jgi:hypothetical protein
MACTAPPDFTWDGVGLGQCTVNGVNGDFATTALNTYEAGLYSGTLERCKCTCLSHGGCLGLQFRAGSGVHRRMCSIFTTETTGPTGFNFTLGSSPTGTTPPPIDGTNGDPEWICVLPIRQVTTTEPPVTTTQAPLWPQIGEDHSKCHGDNEHEVSSQRACQAEALAAGHEYYQWSAEITKCATAVSCDNPTTGLRFDWKIYHLGGL